MWKVARQNRQMDRRIDGMRRVISKNQPGRHIYPPVWKNENLKIRIYWGDTGTSIQIAQSNFQFKETVIFVVRVSLQHGQFLTFWYTRHLKLSCKGEILSRRTNKSPRGHIAYLRLNSDQISITVSKSKYLYNYVQ